MFKFWFRKLMRKVMKKINSHNQSATFNSLRYPKKISTKAPLTQCYTTPKHLLQATKIAR